MQGEGQGVKATDRARAQVEDSLGIALDAAIHQVGEGRGRISDRQNQELGLRNPGSQNAPYFSSSHANTDASVHAQCMCARRLTHTLTSRGRGNPLVTGPPIFLELLWVVVGTAS